MGVVGGCARGASGDDAIIAHKRTARAVAIRRLSERQETAQPRFACAPRLRAEKFCLHDHLSSRDDCRPRARIVDGSIWCSLLEKHSAEIGAMNLRVTHGASLILRRLIVSGTAWPRGRH